MLALQSELKSEIDGKNQALQEVREFKLENEKQVIDLRLYFKDASSTAKHDIDRRISIDIFILAHNLIIKQGFSF